MNVEFTEASEIGSPDALGIYEAESEVELKVSPGINQTQDFQSPAQEPVRVSKPGLSGRSLQEIYTQDSFQTFQRKINSKLKSFEQNELPEIESLCDRVSTQIEV